MVDTFEDTRVRIMELLSELGGVIQSLEAENNDLKTQVENLRQDVGFLEKQMSDLFKNNQSNRKRWLFF